MTANLPANEPLQRSSFGLGLRTTHYHDVERLKPDVDWFEIISENYMLDGGRPLDWLTRIRARYPMVMHGVSLSIGGRDPLDMAYLQALRVLADRVQPAWVSDHLCWTGGDGINLHDLLPLPFTEEALTHVAERVLRVQDFLKRRILIENVSSYVEFARSALTEWEFLAELTRRADCDLLLDVNNIHVSANNHGFAASAFLDGLPAQRIRQIHLAGHSHDAPLIIDTHDHDIPDAVWDLYGDAIRRFGPVPTMIERDAHIPPLSELVGELERARVISARVLAHAA